MFRSQFQVTFLSLSICLCHNYFIIYFTHLSYILLLCKSPRLDVKCFKKRSESTVTAISDIMEAVYNNRRTCIVSYAFRDVNVRSERFVTQGSFFLPRECLHLIKRTLLLLLFYLAPGIRPKTDEIDLTNIVQSNGCVSIGTSMDSCILT